MYGYMMRTSDDVLENLLTHKIVKGRVPEADPTRAHLEMDIDPATEHEGELCYICGRKRNKKNEAFEKWNVEVNKDET